MGLAKLAVTDHNTIEQRGRGAGPTPIIVDQEIDTAVGGELIAYFVTPERVPPHLPVREAIRCADGAL